MSVRTQWLVVNLAAMQLKSCLGYEIGQGGHCMVYRTRHKKWMLNAHQVALLPYLVYSSAPRIYLCAFVNWHFTLTVCTCVTNTFSEQTKTKTLVQKGYKCEIKTSRNKGVLKPFHGRTAEYYIVVKHAQSNWNVFIQTSQNTWDITWSGWSTLCLRGNNSVYSSNTERIASCFFSRPVHVMVMLTPC